MSIRLMSAAWDLNIPSTEKFVLMCLCDYANDDGVCWPSVAVICKKTGKSERTVQAALKWLRDAGFFTFSDTAHKARTYYLDPRKICTPQNLHPAEIAEDPRNNCAPPPQISHPNHQEPSLTTNDSPSDDEPATLVADDVLEVWNDLATKHGLAKVKRLTADRRRKLNARIREHPIEDWTEAIRAIDRNPWLRGENDRGWRANFDFLLQSSSFTKLIEGTYDRKN